jgi:hypothetical protein
MTDRPIIGQIGRPDKRETIKYEIIGELTQDEWNEFIECLTACIKRFPTIEIKKQTYRGMPKTFKEKKG